MFTVRNARWTMKKTGEWIYGLWVCNVNGEAVFIDAKLQKTCGVCDVYTYEFMGDAVSTGSFN